MKQSTMTLTFLVLASALWATVFVSCNTVRGVGKDVEQTGDHIQESTR
jgi:predicted small secreted protein